MEDNKTYFGRCKTAVLFSFIFYFYVYCVNRYSIVFANYVTLEGGLLKVKKQQEQMFVHGSACL